MPNKNKAWWNHWITIVVGLFTLTAFTGGGFNYLYYNFVTKELHQATTQQIIKQFDVVNKELRRDDLKDSYDKLLSQKYDLKKRLGCDTLDDTTKLSLEKDLELTKTRLDTIAAELKDLRAKVSD